MKKQTAE